MHKSIFFLNTYFQNLTLLEQQSIMQSIEENSERLDLLQKTLEVEQSQKKRLLNESVRKTKEQEEENRLKLFAGSTSTPPSTLNHEEAHSKELVDAMVQNSSPSLAPVVKVLTNVQGNLKIYDKIELLFI